MLTANIKWDIFSFFLHLIFKMARLGIKTPSGPSGTILKTAQKRPFYIFFNKWYFYIAKRFSNYVRSWFESLVLKTVAVNALTTKAKGFGFKPRQYRPRSPI